MVDLQNKKRVFWEALILTILVFVLGFLLGILFEDKRVEVIQDYYIQSENSLIDALALANVAGLDHLSCDELIKSNIDFANRIYDEARILENYEDSAKIKSDLKAQHKKYDIMRTLLWVNTLKTNKICETDGVNVVVYAYNNDPDDLTEKAKNTVWSRILRDLKAHHGDDIILIPVAVDTEVASLQPILDTFEISSYPVIIINNEHVLQEVSSVEEIEGYFSNSKIYL